MNALGIKDKNSPQEGKVQVAINTLPWPRSEIVSFKTGEGIGAQKEGTEQFAIAQTGAFGVTTMGLPEAQLQMVGRGAYSNPSF